MIGRSAVCRTTAKIRPSPTHFYFPGLTAKPWHDAAQFDWCRMLEANYETIRTEYLEVQKKSLPSDYVMGADEEHTLHEGGWDWFSYVSKGSRYDPPSDDAQAVSLHGTLVCTGSLASRNTARRHQRSWTRSMGS